MKCTTALFVLSAVCSAATNPGTAPQAPTAAGLPRMREARPANLPAQRYHPPLRQHRKDHRLSSSSSSYHHGHRHSPVHSRGHSKSKTRRAHRSHGRPRDTKRKAHRKTHRDHHRKTRRDKKSSAQKSLKRFAANTKYPHKSPKKATSKSLYVLIKGKYSYPEAAHICWKNGYELASLDARNTGRLVKQMRRGPDGFKKKDAAYWFGAYEKKGRGPMLLRAMAHRKPSIHRLASSSHTDIRIPIICQVRNPTKCKDPFRYEDRRYYCDAPKTICVIGRDGPECQSHCPLGVDKLYKGKKNKKNDSSYSSSYSSSSSRSRSKKHTSLYSSSSSSKSTSWSNSSHSSGYSSYSSSSYTSTSSSWSH